MQKRFAVRCRASRRRCCCCRSASRRPTRVLPAQRRSAPTRARPPSEPQMPVRVLATPDTPIPEVQLLSNGRYHVMVTNAGGGYSRWKDLAVTRWREDATCDNWGTFCYLRDVASGEFWSTAHQPTLKPAQSYEAIFSRGARRVPPPRPRLRDAYRDRRLAGRRHRAAPRAHHQPRRDARGRSRSPATPKSCSRRRPRTRCIRRSATCSCRPRSSASARRSSARAGRARRDEQRAVDVPPDGGARRRRRRDRPTRPIARASSAAAARSPRPRRHERPRRCPDSRGLGARSDRRDPPAASRSSRSRSATIDMVSGVGETREACLALVEQVPGPPSRRSRVRSGVDAQPGGAAADQCHRGRRAALRAPGQLGPLRQRGAARRRGRADARTAAGNRGSGAMPSPATCRSCCCRSATRRTSIWCASWCRRMRTGA